MKRYMTLIVLMIAIFTTPICVHAEALPSDELGDYVIIEQAQQKDKNSVVVYDTQTVQRVVAYKPRFIKVTPQRASFIVNMDVPTSACYIEVEYADNLSFKSGTQRFFKNSNHTRPVISTEKWTMRAGSGKNYSWTATRILRQGRNELTNWKKVLQNKHQYPVTGQDVVDKSWKVLKDRGQINRQRIWVSKVVTPRRKYVHFRFVYYGLNHKYVYSPWSCAYDIKK